MPRPTYPSDEARRKVRPHVKVHLTVASHRRTADVWADLEMRAMLVELWRIAAESFAARTSDFVTLGPGALRSITGKSGHPYAVARIRTLCERMGYPVHCGCDPDESGTKADQKREQSGSKADRKRSGSSTEPARCRCTSIRVEVRNFAKKQGFNSATRGATPPTTPPSDSDSEYRVPKEEEEHAPTERGGDDPPPPAPPKSRTRKPGFSIPEAMDSLRDQGLVGESETWDPLLNLTAPKSEQAVLEALCWWQGEEVSIALEAKRLDAERAGREFGAAGVLVSFWRKRNKAQVDRWVTERRSRALAAKLEAREPPPEPDVLPFLDTVIRLGGQN